MPAFVVVNIAVRDPVRYEDYKRLAQETVVAYGGKYLARGGPVEALEGDWKPNRLVILEFPTVEQARKWWDSPEYRPARRVREECATTQLVVTQGLPA
jgi:uncharacterized protein (DUF1330 family)